MKMFVGLTDYDWFNMLKQSKCEEVNFWKPGGNTNFRVLREGEMFLFKLHAPRNVIVGGGFFLKFSILPSSLAWDAFGIANGTRSLSELRERVYKYRSTSRQFEPDPSIGCIILSMPFYFEERDWIPVPPDWSPNIVQGKSYETSELMGRALYKDVLNRLNRQDAPGLSQGIMMLRETPESQRYGNEQLIKPRVGQGAFKVLITDAYQRKCAITGEKTLPVLEAAHIRPYSEDGPNQVSNGLLLRRDFHTLFDRGYITIGEDYTVEVSKKIKDDFGNGREYYAHHGRKLIILPQQQEQMPDARFLEWHNHKVYLG